MKTTKYMSGDGAYVVEITEAFWKETKHFGEAFIVEFTIDESSNPEHPPGVTRAWVGREKTMLGEDDVIQVGRRMRLVTRAVETVRGMPFTVHEWDVHSGKRRTPAPKPPGTG